MRGKESALIIGSSGQVGRALFRAMKRRFNIMKHDIAPKITKEGEKADVHADPKEASKLITHICIPHSKDFNAIIKEYNKTYSPSLMIIHSSIPPGTTKSLLEKDIPVVHSPTFFDERDFKSIVYWRKLIGYDDDNLGLMALQHTSQFLNAIPVGASISTELADICLGLYYTTCIGICQEIKTIFEALSSNYDVMTTVIDEHNLGSHLAKKSREMLLNPVDYNKIEKDYRIENLDLLPDYLRSAYFKLTVKSNEIYQQKKKRNIDRDRVS